MLKSWLKFKDDVFFLSYHITGSILNLIYVCFCSTAPTDMRYSTELCQEEEKFILKRKEFVFESMKTVFGERGPQSIDEVSKNEEIRLLHAISKIFNVVFKGLFRGPGTISLLLNR